MVNGRPALVLVVFLHQGVSGLLICAWDACAASAAPLTRHHHRDGDCRGQPLPTHSHSQVKARVYGSDSDVAILAKARTHLAICAAFSDEDQHQLALDHAQSARRDVEAAIIPKNEVTVDRVKVLARAYVEWVGGWGRWGGGEVV